MKLRQKLKNLFSRGSPVYYRSLWNQTPFLTLTDNSSITINGKPIFPLGTKEDVRVLKKPIEVFNEILSPIPVSVNLLGLKEKIKTIEERIKLLQDHLGNDKPNDELEALGYLQARKKYIKNKHLFSWPVTTEMLIQELCQKYQVRIAKLQEFYTTLPEEAINEMRKFTLTCKKIRDEKPYFRLLVPDTKEMEMKKRDPILLGSSPFGRWDFVLGAWDKEVAIVDEIIYEGK